MGSPLNDLVGRWAAMVGIDVSLVPTSAALQAQFAGVPDPCQPGASPEAIAAWEGRYGFRLPAGLRAWLGLSNGFYLNGPIIHPLSGIGPMVPFAKVENLLVQPESWFELGNPNVETVCIDLAYHWPEGDCPIFTSGDDLSLSRPKIIAPSFNTWFLELLRRGGREYWFEPGYHDLGDPWDQHRRRTPVPPLPDRLRPFAPQVLPLMRPGADDRSIANTFGLSRGDVEALFRHLQHGSTNFAG
ncbi:SMI1/KNR4 family protein [Singulisphaera sp. PoT]|uniref:SMI1/KNR4 family protein n=1 Tax=Singulisphaera sp. PoT TaxID=3411797 RepID=UPI003BF57C13